MAGREGHRGGRPGTTRQWERRYLCQSLGGDTEDSRTRSCRRLPGRGQHSRGQLGTAREMQTLNHWVTCVAGRRDEFKGHPVPAKGQRSLGWPGETPQGCSGYQECKDELTATTH